MQGWLNGWLLLRARAFVSAKFGTRRNCRGFHSSPAIAVVLAAAVCARAGVDYRHPRDVTASEGHSFRVVSSCPLERMELACSSFIDKLCSSLRCFRWSSLCGPATSMRKDSRARIDRGAVLPAGRIAISCVALILLGVLVLVLNNVEPFHRGFFCSDETIVYPFKASTIKSWVLFVAGGAIPILLVSPVEILWSHFWSFWHNACTKGVWVWSWLLTDIASFRVPFPSRRLGSTCSNCSCLFDQGAEI